MFRFDVCLWAISRRKMAAPAWPVPQRRLPAPGADRRVAFLQHISDLASG